MTANGTVTLVWKRGEDTFCLAKLGEQLALEERCKAGIGAVIQRLENGTWSIRDVRETIRLGLIGAGMDVSEAQEVVDVYVVPPLSPHVLLAYNILSALFVVPEGPLPGKPEADRATAEEAFTKTADSFDPPSTPSAPDSDGIQGMLTE